MALKYLYAPIGYKVGKTYGVLPNVANADLGFIRASGATRVNSSKLIDKGESIGSNDLAPSNFSSGWTGIGTGMTLSTGAAVYNKTSGNPAYIRTDNNLTVTSGVSYRVIIVITSFTSAPEGGGLKYYHNSGSTLFPITGAGTYEYRFTAKSTGQFILDSDTGTSLTVGSVSIREITTTNLNTPRLDYKENTYPTLLTEPASTNLVGYSARGAYGNYPASITQTLAPDGTNMATIPTPDSNFDRYQKVVSAGTYATNTKLTYSWYRKRLSTPVISTYIGDLRIHSLVSSTQVGNTTQIESNIGGYDRFSATFNITDGSVESIIRLYFGELIGTGNSSVAYFGHQLELGEYATSYIPTSGGEITRSADTGAISGDLSSYINSSEGVLEIRAKALFDGGRDVRIGISDGSADNRINLSWREVANRMSIFMKANGSNVLDGGTVGFKNFTHDQTEMATFKIKWKSGDIQVKVNDTIVLTQADTFTMGGIDQVSLGKGYGGSGNSFEGNVQYIKVYDSANDF